MSMEREARDYQEFSKEVASVFNNLRTGYNAPPNGTVGYFMQLRPGNRQIHYECRVKTKEQTIDVGLHFEFRNHDISMEKLIPFEPLIQNLREICSTYDWVFYIGTFGGLPAALSSEITFRIPYQGYLPGLSKASEAAKAMKILIDETEHLL